MKPTRLKTMALLLGTSALLLVSASGALAQEEQPPGVAEPPSQPPPAPPQEDQQAPLEPGPPAQPSSNGDWVYTEAYGWVWVPSGTSTTTIDAQPYAYLYTPSWGWTWYVSPWGAGAPVYRGPRVYGRPFVPRAVRPIPPRVVVRPPRVVVRPAPSHRR